MDTFESLKTNKYISQIKMSTRRGKVPCPYPLFQSPPHAKCGGILHREFTESVPHRKILCFFPHNLLKFISLYSECVYIIYIWGMAEDVEYIPHLHLLLAPFLIFYLVEDSLPR